MVDDNNEGKGNLPREIGLTIAEIGMTGSVFRARRPLSASKNSAVIQVATYQRYSDKKQGQQSEDRQAERNERFNNETIGGIIVRRYNDRARTGVQMKGRTELEQMIRDAEQKIYSVLIIEELSRLAREDEDHFNIFRILAFHNVDVYESSTGVKLDIISLVFKAFVARRERVVLLERSREGRKVAVARGRMMHFPNYGYMWDPKCPHTFKPDPVYSLVVKSIFERVAAGDLRQHVARDLTGKYPTPKDLREIRSGIKPEKTRSVWPVSSVGDIISNPIYLGIIVDGKTEIIHNRDDYEETASIKLPSSQWQYKKDEKLAIVSYEIWYAAQKSIEDTTQFAPLGQSHTYILKNLVFCATCGSKLFVKKHKQYKCNASRSMCVGVDAIKATRLEGEVFRIISRFIINAPQKERQEDSRIAMHKSISHEDLRGNLELEISKLSAELNDGILALCRTGGASDEMVQYWNGLEDRIAEARKQLSVMRNVTSISDVNRGNLRQYLETWSSELPFHCNDPYGSEVIDIIQKNVKRISVEMTKHEYVIKVDLITDCELDRDDVDKKALTTNVKNVLIHSDGVREQAHEERKGVGVKINVQEDEIRLVEASIRQPSTREQSSMLHAILLCLQGETCLKVSIKLRVGENEVFAWLVLYRSLGLTELTALRISDLIDCAVDCAVKGNDGLRSESKQTTYLKRMNQNERVLVLFIKGMSHESIARVCGMTRLLVFKILLGFEIGGFPGTMIERPPNIVLTTEHLDHLKSVISLGVDPDDADAILSGDALCRYAIKKYDLVCTLPGIRNYLRKRAILIRDMPTHRSLPTIKRVHELVEFVRTVEQTKVPNGDTLNGTRYSSGLPTRYGT